MKFSGALSKPKTTDDGLVSRETNSLDAVDSLKAGGDIEAENKRGNRPLIEAIVADCAWNAKVQRLKILSDADVHAKDQLGETALHVTIVFRTLKTDIVDVVKYLLQRKCNPKIAALNGDTALHRAAQMYASLRKVCYVPIRYHLQHKIPIPESEVDDKIEASDDSDLTRARKDLLEVARLLIKASDVNAQNRDGKTPLHYAVCAVEMEMANLLLEHMSDLKASDNNGNTPLHLAKTFGGSDAVPTLLIKAGEIAARKRRNRGRIINRSRAKKSSVQGRK